MDQVQQAITGGIQQQPIATMLAAIIAAVASLVAAALSRQSSRTAAAVERAMRIRQARLDERDLIQGAQGFLIPVENDAMWRDYHAQLDAAIRGGQHATATRKRASEDVRHAASKTADPLIDESLP